MSRTEPPAPGDPLAPREAGAAEAPVLLSARGIRKSFGSNEVLRGIDFSVRRGEVVTLIGPSGSGKTTVLRSLNGLETPDGGALEFDGGPAIDFSRPVAKADRIAMRDRSAMVFQQHNLFPHMTVIENVVEGPIRVQRVPKAQALAEASALLDRVGLAEKRDQYPFQLSGGQQQRVGIVRALALKPDLLLFDEPTSALDPRTTGEIVDILADLGRDGLTRVVVTHAMGFARRVAQRVHVFHQGRVIESGPPDDVLVNPRTAETRAFLEMSG